MNLIKYFLQFIIIIFFFLVFKILGLKLASSFSSRIVALIGPIFRPKKLIERNIQKALPNLDLKSIKRITHDMWSNYGRILSEYMFMKQFRSSTLKNNLIIEGQEILDENKKKK